MEIIPAIDIIDGKCVRLTHGDYNQKKIYNENPLEVAFEFEDAGLTRLHLVDLDGAKAGNVKNEKIAINGWASETDIRIFDFIENYLQKGIQKIFCTDISKDGALQGPSLELYKNIICKFPNLHFIASGGVSKMEDVHELEEI